MSRKLYVGNLPYETGEAELQELFGRAGAVDSVTVMRDMATGSFPGTRIQRWAYPVWIGLICGFALLHALHLGADFPNHTPWLFDYAKYTDEGWWGNAAVRAHLFGNWYLPGDFNPAAPPS